jgi:hypothetical protein
MLNVSFQQYRTTGRSLSIMTLGFANICSCDPNARTQPASAQAAYDLLAV